MNELLFTKRSKTERKREDHIIEISSKREKVRINQKDQNYKLFTLIISSRRWLHIILVLLLLNLYTFFLFLFFSILARFFPHSYFILIKNRSDQIIYQYSNPIYIGTYIYMYWLIMISFFCRLSRSSINRRKRRRRRKLSFSIIITIILHFLHYYFVAVPFSYTQFMILYHYNNNYFALRIIIIKLLMIWIGIN